MVLTARERYAAYCREHGWLVSLLGAQVWQAAERATADRCAEIVERPVGGSYQALARAADAIRAEFREE